MIGDPKLQFREAFLAHRLNRSELVRVTEARDAAGVFETLRDPAVDLRDLVTPARVDRALQGLGLDREFRELDPEAVWTPYQRALYRRLASPDHDPPEVPAPGVPPAAAGDPELVATVRQGFDGWDRDHDTRLVPAEVDRGMARPDLDPEQAAALVVLRTYPGALGSASPHDGDGVTLLDLGLFARAGIPASVDLTGKVNADFRSLRDKASVLLPPGPLQEESTEPFEIRQGRLGSCVMLSAGAGMSKEDLAGLVTPNPDGSATVHFRDGDEEIVGELTPAERLFHATGEAGARWPGLLEMGMGQRLARKQGGAGDGSARSAADGVPPEEAVLALTGRPAARVSLDEISLVETRRVLADVCSRPGPRLCGTRPEPILKDHQEFDVESLHNGIQNSHAYTLLGYDEATDTVRLRNPQHKRPWAMAPEGQETGLFEMPVAHFYASFRWLVSPEA